MNKKIFAAVLAVVLALAAAAAVYGVSLMQADDLSVAGAIVVKPEEQAAPQQTEEAAAGALPAAEEDEEEMDMEIYGLEGEIVELGEGYVVLSTAAHGMVQVNYTDDAVFEGVTEEELAVGQFLFVDYNGMMSRSIPAQVTGLRLYAVMLSGVVSEVGDGAVTIRQDETGMEIVIHLPETAGQLAEGDHITAATNGAMTMSIPPQTSAAQIAVSGK